MKKVNAKLLIAGISSVALALIIILAITFLRNHRVADETARLAGEARSGPRVRTAKVKRSEPKRVLELTGEALPFATATLYAKITGYLSTIAVDKGDTVKKGAVLATIESPETDRNFDAAVVNAKNLQRIANRYLFLLKRKLVSPQEAQQAFTNAKVAAEQARQLRVLKDYERVAAPFDGQVTARFIDPGTLIQNAATPIVTVARTDRLRVYVYVDQRDAASVHPQLEAAVFLEERPDKRWPATITRTTGALDPRTRMLLTEIDFANKPARIVPGSFVKVSLAVDKPTYLEVPAAALLTRNDKQYAGVITDKSTVDLREIRVVRNTGDAVEVVSGLKEGETVGLDLGARIMPGQTVRPITAQAPASPTENRQPSARQHGR